MTNQYSADTHPAFSLFNVSVRSGRLIRFKGQVASIAPGLSVVATAAALCTGGAAHAADECGEEDKNDPQDTVTCGVGDPNYDGGITYYPVRWAHSDTSNRPCHHGARLRGEGGRSECQYR